MGDDAFAIEQAPAVPASMLSSAWGTLLSIGGLVLVLGSLGYAVIEMRSYESKISGLRAQLARGPEAPVVKPTAEPSAAPTAAPTAPPTVVVTETVAAAPVPAPTRAPVRQVAAGAASADRNRELQAQLISLQAQLKRTQGELEAARQESAANADTAKQCNAKLDRAEAGRKDAQAVLDRLQTVCRAANALKPQ